MVKMDDIYKPGTGWNAPRAVAPVPHRARSWGALAGFTHRAQALERPLVHALRT
jgi:hypothetical protein